MFTFCGGVDIDACETYGIANMLADPVEAGNSSSIQSLERIERRTHWSKLCIVKQSGYGKLRDHALDA